MNTQQQAAPKREDREEGRVGILFVGFMGIIGVLVVVLANITAIHVQHRQALNCVDALALAGARIADKSDYFCPMCLTDTPDLDDAAAAHAVQHSLDSLRSSVCAIAQDGRVDRVTVNGSDVEVALRFQAKLVFIPPVIDELIAPELTVESKARLLGE